ncbi:MAG: UDPglucose--hexose-1-phosphate uridylyltransferase GalT [Phormidium sp. OSCR]|nr:MAG: UDPglucose--hexose-1-phosphate uridylyltransferase GalT [Phormidium sp. OSCR]
MNELRHNIITRDWVIIATDRAHRPDEFNQQRPAPADLPPYREDCPFCAGNEARTGVETAILSDHRGWRVRAVLNKYPALSPEGEVIRQQGKLYRSLTAVGVHEVIIEHPYHNVTLALLPLADISNVLRMYRERYRHLRKDPRISTIVIFKNHGRGAGTSLEHPHSQIAATPIVPNQLRLRTQEAIRYFDDWGECIFCRTLAEELEAGDRIVCQSKHFVAFIPYAALSPFHLWIFPRRHASSFEDILDHEIEDLAEILRQVLAKLYVGLNNPDYNYTIRSIPSDEHRTNYFHWYLAVVPRVSMTAGFELGSGMYINTTLPEASAEFLRSISVGDSRGDSRDNSRGDSRDNSRDNSRGDSRDNSRGDR